MNRAAILVGIAFASAGGTAVAAEGATNERFAAPNGQLGAGLSSSPEQHARAYAELGYWHSEPATAHLNSLSWILGAGVKVAPHFELEALLPMAFVEAGGSSSSDTAFATGNLHVGASYFEAHGPLRYKLGAAVEFGPWTSDYETASGVALALGHPVSGGQDLGLWVPEVLSFVAPGRVEYGTDAVFGGDFAVGMHVPTNGGDIAVTVQVAPGIGYYVSDSTLIGVRVPFTIIPTSFDENDFTTLAVEPYARFDLGGGFLNARFTMNIDEPYGFAFDEGKVWALHFGGGGTF